MRHFPKSVNPVSKPDEGLAFYKLLIDNAYGWEYMLDAGGNLSYTSPSCKRITGYSQRDFFRDPDLIKSIVHPEDRLRFDAHVERVPQSQHSGHALNRKNQFLRERIGDAVLFLQQNAAAKQIEVKIDIPATTQVYADQNMLDTILRNLLSNAIKFSREAGAISFQSTTAQGNTIFSITDSGTGMSPDQVDKLFRLDEAGTTPGTSGERGTGLGLIICQEFVQKHGGTISVESREGTGTTFSVSLPVRSV